MKTSSPAPCSDREILTDITSSSLINTLPRPSSSAPRRVSTLDTSSTPLSASGASEPASTPPSTLFGRRGREEDESSSCSPCASSPCPTLVGGTVGFKDNDGKVGGGQASKRRRVDASKETRLEGGRKVESLVGVGGRQVSVYEMVRRRALGFGGGREQVSMRGMLAEYISSNETQVYRCASQQSYRSFAPPFAVAFSQGARAGGKQLLAVADEEGSINLIDTDKDNQWDSDGSRTTFQAHQNAIFDLAWSNDDGLLATASGDQTVKLWDTATQTNVGSLAGHTCTIKTVVWHHSDPHLLSTASRDGSIRIWDRRVPGEDGSIATVNHIKNAHGANTKGRAAKARSATKSVTSVAFLRQSDHLLASSGSYDSTIKVWDLRKSHSWRANPVCVESNEDVVASSESARSRGISSMVLAPDGRRLYAYSTDARIFAFDALNITQPAPLAIFHHPQTVCGSFYLRLAVSPCSRYLANGSSNGAVYLYDTEGKGDDGVRVVGHESEISGISWGKDRLATCSDDNIVRVWSPNQKIARARVNEEVRRKWAGEMVGV